MRSIMVLLRLTQTLQPAERLKSCVVAFLKARSISNFEVIVTTVAGNPVVLILADSHKRLRYSSILEELIRKNVLEKCRDRNLAAKLQVFWRFRLIEETPQTMMHPMPPKPRPQANAAREVALAEAEEREFEAYLQAQKSARR